jgi:hypothetical protein
MDLARMFIGDKLKKVAPIIFSGYNERACITLYRFFDHNDIVFFIVASDENDLVLKTKWKQNVIFIKNSDELDIQLMETVSNLINDRELSPLYIPTSEFLNWFMMENKSILLGCGWRIFLPDFEVYLSLTNKSTSLQIIQNFVKIDGPPIQKSYDWIPPCVLKPNTNLLNKKTEYPRICPDESSLKNAIVQISKEDWFCQDWIEGQSYYFCSYIDQFGNWDGFWQENLLQQPNGKAMIFARSCNNPGVDVAGLMKGLHKFGYFGPLMMEVIVDNLNNIYFIEINPRFWGPLDLCTRACPDLLLRYVADVGLKGFPKTSSHEKKIDVTHWYSWADGIKMGTPKTYPAFSEVEQQFEIDNMLLKYDVYTNEDRFSSEVE